MELNICPEKSSLISGNPKCTPALLLAAPALASIRPSNNPCIDVAIAPIIAVVRLDMCSFAMCVQDSGILIIFIRNTNVRL